jgi:RNA polymerase sigma-70 factor (ECF subfamily)
MSAESLLPTPSLLERVGRGDQQAFGVLYGRHARLVHSCAGRILRDWAEAEDVAQEVFAQVWAQAARFDPLRGTSLAWLLTIARSRALDRLRRRGCRPEDTGQTLPVASTTPVAELLLAVRTALQGLAPEHRRAIELAYFEGLSQTEIAARLGRPLGTVKTWIRRGLLELRRTLA